MGRRVRSLPAAMALVFVVAMTGLLASAGTATAAPPIVIGSCATSVQGAPGQPVSLSPSAVLGVVVNAVRAVPLLGPPLAASAQQAFASLPPIPIGALPNGSGYISGGTIANAVVAQLNGIPLLGPVLGAVAGSVQSTLTSMCGVTVKGVNAAAAPVQDGAAAVADASQQAVGGLTPGGSPGPGGPDPGTIPGQPGSGGPGNGGQVDGGMPGPNQPPVGGFPANAGVPLYSAGWNFGRSPMADYSSIPFARAGLFAPSPGVRYGGAVPGYAPQFGILGAEGDADGVQAAGHAEALGAPSGRKIALPVLLAVFALSGVTAALVRSWVLRRAPSA
jgi:hypothetical protein